MVTHRRDTRGMTTTITIRKLMVLTLTPWPEKQAGAVFLATFADLAAGRWPPVRMQAPG